MKLTLYRNGDPTDATAEWINISDLPMEYEIPTAYAYVLYRREKDPNTGALSEAERITSFPSLVSDQFYFDDVWSKLDSSEKEDYDYWIERTEYALPFYKAQKIVNERTTTTPYAASGETFPIFTGSYYEYRLFGIKNEGKANEEIVEFTNVPKGDYDAVSTNVTETAYNYVFSDLPPLSEGYKYVYSQTLRSTDDPTFSVPNGLETPGQSAKGDWISITPKSGQRYTIYYTDDGYEFKKYGTIDENGNFVKLAADQPGTFEGIVSSRYRISGVRQTTDANPIRWYYSPERADGKPILYTAASSSNSAIVDSSTGRRTYVFDKYQNSNHGSTRYNEYVLMRKNKSTQEVEKVASTRDAFMELNADGTYTFRMAAATNGIVSTAPIYYGDILIGFEKETEYVYELKRIDLHTGTEEAVSAVHARGLTGGRDAYTNAINKDPETILDSNAFQWFSGKLLIPGNSEAYQYSYQLQRKTEGGAFTDVNVEPKIKDGKYYYANLDRYDADGKEYIYRYIKTTERPGEAPEIVQVDSPVWDTYYFLNLRKYDDDGNPITYTVEETPIDGYGVIQSGYDFTNVTYVFPETGGAGGRYALLPVTLLVMLTGTAAWKRRRERRVMRE